MEVWRKGQRPCLHERPGAVLQPLLLYLSRSIVKRPRPAETQDENPSL
jgi:hypothetical protein